MWELICRIFTGRSPAHLDDADRGTDAALSRLADNPPPRRPTIRHEVSACGRLVVLVLVSEHGRELGRLVMTPFDAAHLARTLDHLARHTGKAWMTAGGAGETTDPKATGQ